jgi:hypothetical protein
MKIKSKWLKESLSWGLILFASIAAITHARAQAPQAMKLDEGGRHMAVVRRFGLFIAAVGLAAAVVTPTVSAQQWRGAVVTHLAEFGSDDFVTGSTIGPDGALYVTDGVAGAVLRIDRRSGEVTPYADGLPPKAFPGFDIGGPVDVVFVGRTAYVLVTLVSGMLFDEPFGDPEAKNGLYRIERDGSPTLVADLGQWSVDNPPEPAFFVDTGVHFALDTYRAGFVVTDGHHNRVLFVDRHGAIRELATFGNVVPTGLETTAGQVLVTQMGPIPHVPVDGKVVAVRAGSEPREVASGASMLIDVERGPRGRLYALSQGQWDGVGEGSRAAPDTGRLVVVGRDGALTPVLDADGDELVLDRPTSVEFVGSTGYVVSVTGDVYRVDGLAKDVAVDIRPFNSQNKINPRSNGKIWVAVLSDTDTPFDPLQIKIPSVRFGPGDAKVIRHLVRDMNKDGLGDLLLRFEIRRAGIKCGATEAAIRGRTFDQQKFRGVDSVRTVGCK